MIVYLIEGDAVQARCYREMMERAGWQVQVLPDGQRALCEIQHSAPDIVMMDCRPPDMDGLEMLARIRERYPVVTVVVLTNAMLESTLVEALDAGADDCIVKPPREQELIARVHAKFRTRNVASFRAPAMTIGRYKINTMQRAVYLEDMRIPLSPKEYELVELLARNVGRLVSRQTVLGQIWRQLPDQESSRTLDTHIYQIRQKLHFSSRNGAVLRVVYTHGYRLDDLQRRD